MRGRLIVTFGMLIVAAACGGSSKPTAAQPVTSSSANTTTSLVAERQPRGRLWVLETDAGSSIAACHQPPAIPDALHPPTCLRPGTILATDNDVTTADAVHT